MVDSGFLVNSVLNMLLVVRLPSLVTESVSPRATGTRPLVPGVALMICVGLPIGPDGRHGVCVSFDTTDTQRGPGNDVLPASARLCFSPLDRKV